MLQNIFGIKQFQAQLPKIASDIASMGGHYMVTRRSQPAFVAIPFEDYQAIEDILLEARSPKLQRDVAEGRREYAQGKTKDIKEVIKSLQSKQ